MTKASSVCDEPVMTFDLFPTLIDIAGSAGESDPAAVVDGVSLVSLLKDSDGTLDRDLFWHFPHDHAGGDSPYTAIRSGNWRLLEFHEDKSLELYDLATDIGESHNLASVRPKITASLHHKLERWREEVSAQMPTDNPNYDPDRATEVRRRK